MANTDEQIEELRRENAAIKQTLAKLEPPKYPDAAEVARHLDEVHQMRERNASAGALSHYPRDQLRDYERACPTSHMHEIAMRDSRAPTEPSAQIPYVPGQVSVTNVRAPGGGTGWQVERRFADTGQHPTPHVAQVDRLMDAQDRRDKAELIQREEAVKRAETRKAGKP